jgi:hypothetical protein
VRRGLCGVRYAVCGVRAEWGTRSVKRGAWCPVLTLTDAVMRHHMMVRKPQPTGTIVNLSSITGHQAPLKEFFETSYHTSKVSAVGSGRVGSIRSSVLLRQRRRAEHGLSLPHARSQVNFAPSRHCTVAPPR